MRYFFLCFPIFSVLKTLNFYICKNSCSGQVFDDDHNICTKLKVTLAYSSCLSKVDRSKKKGKEHLCYLYYRLENFNFLARLP